MRKVTFVKYTSNGNNFVIVDETKGMILSEHDKSSFAYQATNVHFGVGADNFLVIQPCKKEILSDINKAHHYWDNIPDVMSSDYIFRMFEPNGIEAFCCANGLMCISNYLNLRYGVTSARIVTEIPTSHPNIISIGTEDKNATSWVNLGQPRRIPNEMAVLSISYPYDESIDIIKDVEISFRKYDLSPFSQEQTLKVSGYLVFTGEPHLVIFPEFGFSLKELQKLLFIFSPQNHSEIDKDEKRLAFGSWLVNHIGKYFNRKYTHYFPTGINVNFAQINKDSSTLEYRCFERGINRETLACGTGALATSFIASRLNFLDTDRFVVLPHRCRWDDPKARIMVVDDESGWIINGSPVMLFEGSFIYHKSINENKIISKLRVPYKRLNIQFDDPCDSNEAFIIH